MIGIFHLGEEGQCPRAARLATGLAGSQRVAVVNESSSGISLQTRAFSWPGRATNFILLILGSFDRYLARKYKLNGVLPSELEIAVCHDLLILPLIMRRVRCRKVVFDAREYYPLQFEDSLLWRLTAGRLASYICKKYLVDVDSAATVSPGIADAYAANFGVAMRVIYSSPAAKALQPTKVGEVVKLVHHGNGTPNRCLENMIEAARLLGSGYTLDLYIVEKSLRYYARLVELAAEVPNVVIKKPVSPDQIVETLARYDIGLFVPPPATFNLRYSMPNKMFEFIQARLMIIVSKLPDASGFVTRHGLGEVSPDASSNTIAHTIAATSRARIAECKRSADRAASEFTAEKFLAEFGQLI